MGHGEHMGMVAYGVGLTWILDHMHGCNGTGWTKSCMNIISYAQVQQVVMAWVQARTVQAIQGRRDNGGGGGGIDRCHVVPCQSCLKLQTFS